MTDIVPSGKVPGPAFKVPSFGSMFTVLRSGDVALASAVMAIIVILILPMPPVLLDGCWPFRSSFPS